MDATDRTPIDNVEGLESFAGAWANGLINLNDKPQQRESSTDESTTAIDISTVGEPTDSFVPVCFRLDELSHESYVRTCELC